MVGKEIRAVLLGSALAIVAMPAEGAGHNRVVRIDSRNQSLAAALLDIAQQGGVELMLAAPDARTMAAPKVRGRYDLDDAFSKLLSGSGLTYRRSEDGAYVITSLARAPRESESAAVPEILVTGKKTQNSDIRRGENDIQPYKVWTSEDVAQSHSSDIDTFLRNRVTSNAQIGSASQLGGGNNSSEVNLRGLGSDQTLVLVDGRRLPGGPSLDNTSVGISQSDLNGIPLSAIDRIEVLNSTAGGIYGPGATAGVVNIVLKRDYHGADLGVTYGLSDRGDAATKRLDAKVGFSPDSERTQIMIAASRTWGADLRRGNREFTIQSRARQQQRDPTGFAAFPPISGSVNITSLAGDALKLDTRYGGASLGASTTSVPSNYGGVVTDGGALYRANAGRLDSSLAPDASGTDRSLLTRPRLASLLANVRHKFGDTFEAYVDLLVVENDGRATVNRGSQIVEVDAGAPTNPFQQDILVTLPTPGYVGTVRYRNRTARLTGGLIVNLPHTWKINADYSAARATIKTTSNGPSLEDGDDSYYYAAEFGFSGSPSGTPVNPLAGQAAFLAAIAPFKHDYNISSSRRNDFGDLTLRLAGPIAELGGGPLSLSVLGEDRREHIPASATYFSTSSGGLPIPALSARARSAYAELRAPVIDRSTGSAGLRGLEFQLAIRYDANRSTLPANFDGLPTGKLSSKADAALYTAGLRFSPFAGVMLRASMASGFLPPAIDQIGSSTASYTSRPTLQAQSTLPDVNLILPTSLRGPADPLRGGAKIGTEAVFSVIRGGSTHLQPELARSISAGIVLTPVVLERLRLSVDYTRIDKRHEIVSFHDGDQAYFLAHESELADRVIREPLTDADRAKGYTGGVVTIVDTSSFNIGKTLVEAVDAQVDYRIPTGTIGDFSVHAAGTWQPHLTRRNSSQSAAVDSAGYADGPLTWRASGGINWQHGPLGLGLIATYYHGYRAAKSTDTAATAVQTILLQGGSRIPAQLYFDLSAARHFALAHTLAGLASLDIRLGIENVLDHRPPIIVDPNNAAPGYSLYGDPRLRRFELALIGHF